jgi:hypothetical protein
MASPDIKYQFYQTVWQGRMTPKAYLVRAGALEKQAALALYADMAVAPITWMKAHSRASTGQLTQAPPSYLIAESSKAPYAIERDFKDHYRSRLAH